MSGALSKTVSMRTCWLTTWRCLQALVAWGGDTIVVAFRGTASFQNMLNDVQVRSDTRYVVFVMKPVKLRCRRQDRCRLS